jgi:hypothetical protein
MDFTQALKENTMTLLEELCLNIHFNLKLALWMVLLLPTIIPNKCLDLNMLKELKLKKESLATPFMLKPIS